MNTGSHRHLGMLACPEVLSVPYKWCKAYLDFGQRYVVHLNAYEFSHCMTICLSRFSNTKKAYNLYPVCTIHTLNLHWINKKVRNV